MPEMKPVYSSHVDAVGYDVGKEELHVQWRTGRVSVYHGVPAPYNLPVPPYRFTNDKTIRVGENDPSATAWNFDSIRQL